MTPKTPSLVQVLRTYLLYKPCYGKFSVKISKFSLPLQQGSSEQSLTDTINLANAENPYCVQASGSYLLHKRSYNQFCVEITNFCYCGSRGLFDQNLTGITGQPPK